MASRVFFTKCPEMLKSRQPFSKQLYSCFAIGHLPSALLFQNESKCKSFVVKMIFA